MLMPPKGEAGGFEELSARRVLGPAPGPSVAAPRNWCKPVAT